MDTPEPVHQHRWLQALVGDWTWETEPVPGHDHPPMQGTEQVRAIGGFWVELAGEGGHGATRMTLGYDPGTRRFVGTWVGGMMSHLWVYDGELDAEERVLVLTSTGPAMDRAGTAEYRDVVEIVGPAERALHGWYADAQGTWVHFMTTRFRRVAR